MADVIGAFFRGFIELVIHAVVEGVIKLLGWRNLLTLLALLAIGAAVFYFASPHVLT